MKVSASLKKTAELICKYVTYDWHSGSNIAEAMDLQIEGLVGGIAIATGNVVSRDWLAYSSDELRDRLRYE